MNDLCKAKHKRVDERLDHHEKWLEDHEDKIDTLNRSDARNTTAIENLCEQLRSQTKAIWGLVSIAATALVGFFFYVIQSKFLK